MSLTPTILFSDHSLLIILKPPGLLTLPDGYNPALPHIRSLLQPVYGKLWIVHRLDRDTSGILLIARNETAHRNLNAQFEKGAVQKTYHALVVGNPNWDHKTCAAPLRSNVGRRKRSVVDMKQGKTAVTDFHCHMRFSDFTLVQANPRTGRTHQIRTHLYTLGHPIVSDGLYGTPIPPHRKLIPRLALHAFRIRFTHPVSGEAMDFEAPYPIDFQSMLSALLHKNHPTD